MPTRYILTMDAAEVQTIRMALLSARKAIMNRGLPPDEALARYARLSQLITRLRYMPKVDETKERIRKAWLSTTESD
jgi:hypothetical protein